MNRPVAPKIVMTAHEAKLRRLARLGKNFARAGVAHIKAGRPKATDEVVEQRFAICQGCELFEAKGPGYGRCGHPSCGCHLKRVSVKGINKLRWADQECPLKKWLAVKPNEQIPENPVE